jgi:hypothetical protein
MNLFHLFLYLAIFCVFFNVVITMIIISELQKRKVKINFFLLRLYIPKYVHKYKKITLEETGKVGALYYWFVGSINLAWILAVVGFILKALV